MNDATKISLYAVPGIHGDKKQADAFNRIQRSHQNYFEMLDSYIAMTLLGGLKYPIACSLGCTLLSILMTVLCVCVLLLRICRVVCVCAVLNTVQLWIGGRT